MTLDAHWNNCFSRAVVVGHPSKEINTKGFLSKSQNRNCRVTCVDLVAVASFVAVWKLRGRQKARSCTMPATLASTTMGAIPTAATATRRPNRKSSNAIGCRVSDGASSASGRQAPLKLWRQFLASTSKSSGEHQPVSLPAGPGQTRKQHVWPLQQRAGRRWFCNGAFAIRTHATFYQ